MPEPDWTWMFIFREGGPHDYRPPVDGWYFRHGREIYFSSISTGAHEGQGYVGRLLADAQAQADAVKVPTVISARLMGMLIRRGYRPEREYDKAFGWVETMVWRRFRPPS